MPNHLVLPGIKMFVSSEKHSYNYSRKKDIDRRKLLIAISLYLLSINRRSIQNLCACF